MDTVKLGGSKVDFAAETACGSATEPTDSLHEVEHELPVVQREQLDHDPPEATKIGRMGDGMQTQGQLNEVGQAFHKVRLGSDGSGLVLVDLDESTRGQCKVTVLFGHVLQGFLAEDLDWDPLVSHHVTGATFAEIADVATFDRGELDVDQQLLITKRVSGICGRKERVKDCPRRTAEGRERQTPRKEKGRRERGHVCRTEMADAGKEKKEGNVGHA